MDRPNRRHAGTEILELLVDFPVVVLTGARQVGKSTLAQQLVAECAGTYFTLDDVTVRSQALADPQGFVAACEGLTVIDEVQLVPELLRAVKWAVDRDRTPGRFLLTGSANLLRMNSVGESLAGRSAWFELGPLTWAEIENRPRSPLLDLAFEAKSAASWVRALPRPVDPNLGKRSKERALRGGMPATLKLGPKARRSWYQGYRQTFLERDLRQLSNIENLPEFARLLTMAALRTGSLLNRSALGNDVGLTVATTRRYLDILETAYQFYEVPPYHVNQGKRLVKTPKLYANDVGLVSFLSNLETYNEALEAGRAGAFVETWAVNELMSIDRLAEAPSRVSFFRTSAGREVDLVFERGRSVVAVEIKASATVGTADTAGLRELREALGARFKLGIVAHLGPTSVTLDPSLCAVPLGVLLGMD